MSSSDAPSRVPAAASALYTIAVCLTIVGLSEAGDSLMRAPWTRTVESILCEEYWRRENPARFPGPIDEQWCKVKHIQADLAMIKGWHLMLSCVPSLVLTIPLGVVADRYGRKPVLIASLVGILLSYAWMQMAAYLHDVVDIRWSWGANAMLLLGGGSSVSRNVFFSILADVAAEDQRTLVFFQMTAVNFGAPILATPLAWWLMQSTVALPMLLAMVLMLLSIALSLFLPETLIPRQKDPAAEPLLERCTPSADTQKLRAFQQFYFILASPTLTLLVTTFFVNCLGWNAAELLVQFASQQFSLSLASASLLGPLMSAVNFLLLTAVLPWVDRLLIKHFALGSLAKDLAITRVSLLFLAAGLLGIALSPPHLMLLIIATVAYGCGAGYLPAVRSLATSFASRDETNRLYAVISIIEEVGLLLSGPTLSSAFNWGLSHGGYWVGMPFFLTSALFAMVAMVFWCLRLPSTQGVSDEAAANAARREEPVRDETCSS